MNVTPDNSTILGAKDLNGVITKNAYVPCNHTHSVSEIDTLQSTLNNKSNTGHTHNINEIPNLEQSLNGKADTAHRHSVNDVEGLSDTLALYHRTIVNLGASKADASDVYTKVESDNKLSTLTTINNVTFDVDSNNPFDISKVVDGSMHHLHTSANSITLASCITSSISGTDIKFLGDAGSTATRDFIIRKYRLGTHFIVELIAAY